MSNVCDTKRTQAEQPENEKKKQKQQQATQDIVLVSVLAHGR